MTAAVSAMAPSFAPIRLALRATVLGTSMALLLWVVVESVGIVASEWRWARVGGIAVAVAATLLGNFAIAQAWPIVVSRAARGFCARSRSISCCCWCWVGVPRSACFLLARNSWRERPLR